MPLIEGIGDEVTYFFIFLLIFIVVCIAWWTTNISEQHQLRTVFLIERRLRRQRTRSRLTNHTQSATLVEGTSNTSEASTETLRSESMEPIASNKPPGASTSVEQQNPDETDNSVDDEQNAIVETMDTDNCVLRQRRLAFYDNRRDTLIDDADSSPLIPNLSNADQISSSSSYDDMLDSEQVLMEHNYADHAHGEDTTDTASVSFGGEGETTSRPEPSDPSHIRIKLKYINDDLRHVDGQPHESLGDFKRRHFQAEISTNKLVRLIFNGKVLQQDNQTLQNCGLFDNCVVHCLVHNRRPNTSDTLNGGIESDDFVGMNNRPRMPQMNNNNNNRESDLGNVLFAVISFILGSAWYFRYVYAHLYTVTATIALVAVTGIFTVVIIGMYFPDHETTPPRVDTQQR